MESALIFGGIAVSLLVEYVKSKYNLTTERVLGFIVLLAATGGGAFYLMQMFGLWQGFLQILIAAGAFYAFIIRNLKKDEVKA